MADNISLQNFATFYYFILLLKLYVYSVLVNVKIILLGIFSTPLMKRYLYSIFPVP